jgi:hypothetical protein
MGDRRAAHKILVGRLDRRRQLGKPRFAWEDNIKKCLQNVGKVMDLIDLAHDRNRWRVL